MIKLIKKNSNFFGWVFLPSLLLAASVFGVNFISRPAQSLIGATCSTSAECNANRTNNCIVEDCQQNTSITALVVSDCQPVGFDSTNAVCNTCNVCGNGRCEEPTEFDPATGAINCPLPGSGPGQNDCAIPLPAGVVSSVAVTLNPCLNANGAPIVCGEVNGTVTSVGSDPVTQRDLCCPANCTGAQDIDCACNPACGNGQVEPGEQCDFNANPTGCPTGETCNQQCQCVPPTPACGNGVLDPGEECEPDANTDGCDSKTCQCVFILEGSGSPGCGGRKDGKPLNARCAALLPTLANQAQQGQGSVMPTSLLQSMDWLKVSQLSGALLIPGGIFTAIRFRKRRK